MIQVEFDGSEGVNLLILALALALLLMQSGLILMMGRSDSASGTRRKLALNLLLWLAIVAFILRPFIVAKDHSQTGIILSNTLSSSFARQLKDSLSKAAVTDVRQLKSTFYDTLLLVGQDFDPTLFKTIGTSPEPPIHVSWIPAFQPGQIRTISWKAIVSNGELQHINGSLLASDQDVLRTVYGGQTLDSVRLKKGEQPFHLSFPVFSVGRSIAELMLNDKLVATIRYYAHPSEPLTFEFILDNPDFESRNLARWLGRNGNSVLYRATLSGGITSNVNINKAGTADIILTNAAHASTANVRKGIASGKSVLFMNLTHVPAEIGEINKALGTRIQVNKVSNDAEIKLSNALTALPYRFISSNFDLRVPGYPVIVEKTTGKVGVSLLNETFPMLLNGDSIAYQKVWTALIAAIRPVTKSRITMNAPVFSTLPVPMNLNNFPTIPTRLRTADDTLFTSVSLFNKRSATGNYIPTKVGWNALNDSLGTEFYVETTNTTTQNEELSHFVKTYNARQAALQKSSPLTHVKPSNVTKLKWPDWVWFVLLIVVLGAVWIEPKL